MQMTTRRLGLVGGVVLVLFIGLVVYFLGRGNTPQNSVTITNIQDCSPGVDPGVLADLSNTAYGFVEMASKYNKQTTKDHYEATIRENSCKTNDFTVKNSSGKNTQISNSTILLDVPEAKQSWVLSYDWFTQGSSADTGINGATPKCPAKEQLIYGDFNCEKVLNITIYETDSVDPILQYMPYSGAGFRLEYNPETQTVSVIILPPPGTKNVSAFTENTKAIIPAWFQKRGLDQTKYRVLYNSDIRDD